MALGGHDFAELGAYFAAILAVGVSIGRGERTTHDFFLGGKRQHWFVVGLSIIATEVSALTFLNVPADAFQGDWTYLQMYAGAFVGRVLVVLLLLPAFYGGSVTTVYEYLGQRFGPWTRTTASLMFFASRIVGSGIRLLAASLAIALVFDWRLEWVVIGAAAIAITYTTFGGIKAIIWTDALQALVFLGGALAVLVFLFISIPGGWTDNLTTVYEGGKLHTFTWDWNPNNESAFWVLMVHATVMNMAALGTDQDLTQRMLTCPDLRRGQRALMFNALAGLPIVCMFLLIGALMWAYFQTIPGAVLPADVVDRNDLAFPHFIAHALPTGTGLKGLLLAGIFAAAMSSLDSALGALSSCAVTDFYQPFIASRGVNDTAGHRDLQSARRTLRVSRVFTFLFGVLLAAVALAFAGYDDLLWEAFRWVGLIFGGMLGVFLLGVTTKRRGSDRANTVAMLSSVVLLVGVKLFQEQTDTVYIAWPWWVVIGTTWTYAIGVCFPAPRTSGQAVRRRFPSSTR